MKNDDLGTRMKEQYENRTRIKLPRRTNTIIRLDGKAFHTFTKDFNRPFDVRFIYLMNETAEYLCENIQGCKFAYVQSDEISLLLTDYDKITSEAFFDGNIQKITSITASMATMIFNEMLNEDDRITEKSQRAMFDSRAFTIADKEEVINYFIWRQKDAVRNSVQMVAQSLYSHKELQGKNCSQLQDMIFNKGQNWNDYPIGQKRGRCVVKDSSGYWTISDPPTFTQDRDFIGNLMNVTIEDNI
ncbi:MAG TPA: tRNA(His) guanylyltransferase Thg1 family protein [Patescibacteria group bacterium]|nr:tRNA(His) guanylyltransferase Thg1 family protein [Patescibacteria group bacterium]